jgi:hypothetical protein
VAAASTDGQLWWNVRAAPWSIKYGDPCQNSMFGLRHERSTLPTSASNHSTEAANAGSGVHASGSKPSEPGR